jgi:F-type H+-transporting ATPase subunit delta
MAMEKPVEHATVLDTAQQRVGEIYARALLAIGQSTGQIDGLMEQLCSFADAVQTLPSLRGAMVSPRVSFEQKSRLIDKALGNQAAPMFKNFIKVLARKGRFECLPAVRAAAVTLYNEYRGRIEAVMTTAEPISDENRRYAEEQLAKKLGKQVELQCRVDPSIIAGSIIRVGDTVYDGSAQTQLRRARHAAVQRAFQEIRDSFGRFAKEI